MLLSVLLVGCASLVKLHYGITQPKIETPQSLTRFLRVHHYPLKNFYIFKDTFDYITMLKNPVYKKNVLNTIIVDKDFQKITIDTVHCQWSGGYFVNRLNKDTLYLQEPSLDVRKLLSMIISIPDSLTPSLSKGDFDFIVINIWAKFIGKMNERLFATIPVAEKRKDLKIVFINLNIDIQKSWNIPKDRIFNFK
jgi:hypothetical protein